MGKGTIISGGTDGQYSVQINYARDAYTAKIAAFDATIAQYNLEIAAWTGDAAGLAALELGRASAEVSKAYLIANTPSDETVAMWCADITEDLSGEVGTIEIPGESGTYNIQPGYEANAVYDAARDGQLVPTIAMTSAAAFYNLAMLPGWQKWKPTYRYGIISDIDTGADTATVTLDAAVSSQQSLGVNQDTILTGVAVEYMTCNASAFDEGDSVLVQFTGQDFTTPKIIGFKDNPKSCEFIRVAAISAEIGGVGYTVWVDLETRDLRPLVDDLDNPIVQPYISTSYTLGNIAGWNGMSIADSVDVIDNRGPDPDIESIYDTNEYEFRDFSPGDYGMEHIWYEFRDVYTFDDVSPLTIEQAYETKKDVYIDDTSSETECSYIDPTYTAWPIDFPIVCFRQIATEIGDKRIYCTTRAYKGYHETWNKVGVDWEFNMLLRRQSFDAFFYHLDGSTTLKEFDIPDSAFLGDCETTYFVGNQHQYARLSGRYNLDKKVMCFYESMRINVDASYSTETVLFEERLDSLYVLAIPEGDESNLLLENAVKIDHSSLLGFFNMTDNDLVNDHYFAVDEIFT